MAASSDLTHGARGMSRDGVRSTIGPRNLAAARAIALFSPRTMMPSPFQRVIQPGGSSSRPSSAQ